MKKLLYSVLFLFVVLIACSKEEEPTPPPTPKFTVSLSASEGGSVSTEGGTYDQGTKVTVTATPDGEFLFDRWSDGNTNNPREITVTSNLSLTANFVKKKYALTVNIEGEGTVQEEVIVQGSTSTTEYNSGTSVRLTATPSDEWVFSGWSGSVESTDNPIEVSVDEAKEITATFKLKQYDLTINIEGEGTVSETIITQPTLYDSGTVVKLEATPSDEWVFSGWSGSVESTDNPIEVSVDEAKEVTATFKLKQYDLTINIEGEGTVSETIITQPTLYDSGTVVKLEATPSDEWVFSGWSGSVESTDNPIEVSVDEAKEITATFKLKQYDLTINIEGEGTVSETIITQPTLYDSGTVVKLEATPSDEWVFSGWSGSVESTDNPIEVSVDEAKEVTATFKLKQYDLTINIEGEGTVSETIITQPTLYDSGTVVKLEATPSEGWEFVGWKGTNISTSENSPHWNENQILEVSISDYSYEIEARFVPILQLEVNVIDDYGTASFRKLYRDETGYWWILLEATSISQGREINYWEVENATGVIVNGSEESENPLNPVSILLNDNHVINLHTKPSRYSVNIRTDGEGEIVLKNANIGETYEYGTRIDIQASPNPGWRFAGWYFTDPLLFPENSDFGPNLSGIDSSFWVTRDLEFIARFEEVEINGEFLEYVIEYGDNKTESLLINTTIGHSKGGFSYNRNGRDYLLKSGASVGYNGENYRINGEAGFPILFEKESNKWTLKKKYKNVRFELPRNYALDNFQNPEYFVLGDTAENFNGDNINIPISRNGDIFKGRIIDSDITWEKLNTSEYQSYFHSTSIGDLDNDGDLDVIGGNFVFRMNNQNDYEILNLQDYDQQSRESQEGILEWKEYLGGGTSLIADFNNDGINETAFTTFGEVGGDTDKWNNGLRVYTYDINTEKFYQSFQSISPYDLYTGTTGGVYMEANDYNNDGLLDIAISKEGLVNKGEAGTILEIWLNLDGNNFQRHQYIPNDRGEFRTFDANNDGYLDIITESSLNNSKWMFRRNGSNEFAGYDLSKLIFLNDGTGRFYNPNIENLKIGQIDGNSETYNPDSAIPYLNNEGKLGFIIFQLLPFYEDYQTRGKVLIHDVIVNLE